MSETVLLPGRNLAHAANEIILSGPDHCRQLDFAVGKMFPNLRSYAVEHPRTFLLNNNVDTIVCLGLQANPANHLCYSKPMFTQ